MHYVLYLDEFGHIGPYVSREHVKYNDSPVFGLAGLMLPVEKVRDFAVFFYQLKCNLLKWELDSRTDKTVPVYQWEKKGSALFTEKNFTKYPMLRKAANRLLNKIGDIGGFLFYTGEHKTTLPASHDSKETFKRQLLQSVRKVDRYCAQNGHTFLMILDHQDAGDEWREKNIEVCTLAMFEGEQSRKL